MPIKKVIFLLVAFVCATTNAADMSRVTIPPMSVAPPQGSGWKVAQKSEYVVAFQRINRGEGNQTSAYASLMRFHAPDDLAAMETELRRHVTTVLPSTEISVLEAQYNGDRKRGYPCVSATVVAKTTVVHESDGSRVSVPTDMYVLTCRQKGGIPLGFMAMYSHSSFSKSATFEAEAKNFTEGVTLSPIAAKR